MRQEGQRGLFTWVYLFGPNGDDLLVTIIYHNLDSLNSNTPLLDYIAPRIEDEILSTFINCSQKDLITSCYVHFHGTIGIDVRVLASSNSDLVADDVINEEHLNLELTPMPQSTSDNLASAVQRICQDGLPLKEIVRRTIAAVEREVLVNVLQRTGGNKAKADRLLHIDYKTIHTKIKQYGIIG